MRDATYGGSVNGHDQSFQIQAAASECRHNMPNFTPAIMAISGNDLNCSKYFEKPKKPKKRKPQNAHFHPDGVVGSQR
jgi:hypothetical protein